MNDSVEKEKNVLDAARIREHDMTLEIWKKVVDVQMHFNDLCLRLRSIAISILGVLIGASAIAFRFSGNIAMGNFSVHTAAVFLSLSIFTWAAFYLMDRYWYHELLKGSVHHGLDIEHRHKQIYPEITLAHTIKEQSHQSLKINAATKLNVFYWGILFVQIIVLFLMLTGSLDASR